MPYYYLYDSYLAAPSYAAQLIKLEATLTDLGIQGRIGRLTLLKSVRDLVEAALRDGADTVVAVGNDLTLSRIAEVVAQHPEVTLGLVPFGEQHQEVARLLGIPRGVLACHVLSSRLTEVISLGKINNQYFLCSAVTRGRPLVLCEYGKRQYEVTLAEPHEIKVCNLDRWGSAEGEIANPQNNVLEAVLRPQTKHRWWHFGKAERDLSLITVQSVKLTSSDDLPITVDGHRVVKAPVTITLARERLKVIVGKKRLV